MSDGAFVEIHALLKAGHAAHPQCYPAGDTMKHLNSIILAVSTAAVLSSSADLAGQDWTRVRPAVTTEAELLEWFGPPTNVLATFPWNEWNAKWKKRPVSLTYRLRYESGSSTSDLLVGPGGSAESVEVIVADKKVHGIRWRYGGPFAKTAAANLRASAIYEFRARNSGSVASAALDGGFVLVEIGPDDTEVEILLQLK
jgi:hypothetical protein